MDCLLSLLLGLVGLSLPTDLREREFDRHDDAGQPTASLGRLSGGVAAFGVSDDLIVSPEPNGWSVWRADVLDAGPLGVFMTTVALRAGLDAAIADLWLRPTRVLETAEAAD